MDRILSFVFLISFAQIAMSDITIIDVRKNIPLSDDDPSYTDYYISAGDNESLKKNQVVTVIRNVPIRDNSGAQSFGEIPVPVAQVKIVSVFSKISVGRVFKNLSREELPMLEQTGILAGDKIETKDSFIDNSKPKKKAQAAAAKPVLVPVAVQVTVTDSAPVTASVVPGPKAPASPSITTKSAPSPTVLKPLPVSQKLETPAGTPSAAETVTESASATRSESVTESVTETDPVTVSKSSILSDGPSTLPDALLESPVKSSTE